MLLAIIPEEEGKTFHFDILYGVDFKIKTFQDIPKKK